MNGAAADSIRFVPVADHALLVEIADEITDAAGDAVVALDRAIAASTIDGLVEVVPAYVSLLVDFDPLVTHHDRIEAAIRTAMRDAVEEAPAPPREHVATACFDDDLAPDLAAVAEATGASTDDVIDTFLAVRYRVAMYGFAPGYAYLAGVDERIRVPRKPVPVRDVPAGSIIIAGQQCLITTVTMPTGWSVIGRSGTQVLQPESDEPFLFDPGDGVRFRRISRDELEAP